MEQHSEFLRAAAQGVAGRLRADGAVPDSLGAYVAPRKRLFGTKPARIERLGAVWRLGVLLLRADEDAPHPWLAAGPTLRAHEPPAVRGYTSESARHRDELRHAAIRGGFEEGQPVHYDAVPIERLDASSTPVSVRGDELVVRWRPGCTLAQATRFDEYVEERRKLLESPRM